MFAALFGYAQAAKPKDIEDAYAFLCKFKSKEITATSMSSDNIAKKHFKNRDLEYKQQNKGNHLYPNHSQQSKPSTQEHHRPDRNEVEQMDTSTTRSRLTLNKKLINNHEITKT